MNNQPTLTPLEALERARREDGFTQDGFTYTLDGPMGTPFELLAPFAVREGSEAQWFCSGEPGDKVTEKTTWMEV